MSTMNDGKFWTIADFSPENVPEFGQIAYEKVLPYVRDFLCAQHPFREGVVCPFVPSALKNDRVYFTICSDNDSLEGHSKHIQSAVDFYLKRKSEYGGFGALIILFPQDFDIGKLLDLHFLNKEKCVTQALMLGALYATNQAPSLHNKEYFPLRTPTPILVIRDMVTSDLVFLDPRHYNIKKRLTFLESFIETFGSHKGLAAQEQVREARQLYRHYQKRQRISLLLKLLTPIFIALLLLFLLL